MNKPNNIWGSNILFCRPIHCVFLSSNNVNNDVLINDPENIIDFTNISNLCDQVLEISDYRNQLYEYLKNRMLAVAPNLTALVGELVGARLIAHAGSLLNLAKHPSSTVQILGSEKALFRAMKTKHDTPKYGLIYHASLVGQSGAKFKGKVSRMLAAKAALAIRVDALGEDVDNEMGIEHRATLEKRLSQLEQGMVKKISGTGKQKAKFEKYTMKRYDSLNFLRKNANNLIDLILK